MSRWFRVYAELIDDPKFIKLGPDLRSALLTVWCIASVNDGCISSLEDTAIKFRINEQRTKKLLDELERSGFIDRDSEGTLRPHNWDGRQFKSDTSNERVKKYREKRSAAGLPQMGDYSAFRASLIERDGERCVYCSATSRLVVDHMEPIALGGADDIDNLALACRECNSGKAGRTPELACKPVTVPSAASALKRYRDRKRDVTVTVTPPDTEQITDTEQKQIPEANASDAGASDPRFRLFNDGLEKLRLLTGKGPDSCRSFLGKCLREVGDDAILVLAAIEDAERNQVIDPSAYIAKLLKGRSNGQSRSGIIQAADDLRQKIASFDGPSSGDRQLRSGEGQAPPRLLSNRGSERS